MEEIFKAIEEEKISLLDRLKSEVNLPAIENLMELPRAVDMILCQTLTRAVVKYARELFDGERPNIEVGSFRYQGVLINVEDVKDAKNEKNILVTILIHDTRVKDATQRKYRSLLVNLSGNGTYSSVTFLIPKLLANPREALLAQLAAEVFSVGYNWMNERIVDGIRRVCAGANQELYEYLRIMVPDRKLLDGFIFSAAAEDKDFVLLNDIATRSAMLLAADGSAMLGRSVADLVMQMMLEVVPISTSVIRDVAQQRRAVDVDLSGDQYYQIDDDRFSQALRAVWGQTVCCFPIVTGGDFLLVAFFLPEHKATLEPLLMAHVERLQRIATTHTKDIRTTLRIAEGLSGKRHGKSIEHSGDLAELLGRFFGGVLESMHH